MKIKKVLSQSMVGMICVSTLANVAAASTVDTNQSEQQISEVNEITTPELTNVIQGIEDNSGQVNPVSTGDDTDQIDPVSTGDDTELANSSLQSTEDVQDSQLDLDISGEGGATASSDSQIMENGDSISGSSPQVTTFATATPLATVVQSGQYGTAPWEITDDGILTINTGTFPDNDAIYLQGPWTQYADIITKIVFTGPVTDGIDTSYLFNELANVTEIQGLNYLDTNRVTNMEGMFSGMSSLTSLDISTFNTTGVTNMQAMFSGMHSLKSLNVNGLDTSDVTNMEMMFNGVGLTTVDLSSFNTASVHTMYAMFQGASFVSLDISNFNMTNVVDTNGMFNVLDKLRELKLGTNCRFPNDTGLPDIPITSEYTGKWQNIDTGTATKPNGAFVFASNELESYYDGATMVGTYVWQPRPLDVSQPVKAADVTVNYLDSNGNKIHDPQLISGNVGDAYDASSDVYQLKIDGYTLDESKLPTNVKGVLSDTPQSINYHYIEVAQPVKAADVTVNYLDSNGNKIHDPQLISGNVGDAYDASSDVYQLKIDGYTLDESKLPTNVKGVLSDTPQTVDYTYKKDTLATTLNDSKIAPSGQSKFGNLPNAGDNDLISVIAMISGLFVMIGLWISKQVKQRYK